ELALAKQRCWQKERFVVERKRRRCKMEMDVVGKSQLRDAVPNPLGTVWIMVPGKQVPVNVDEGLHALERRTKRMRIGSLAVVDVARNENVLHAVTLGMLAETLNGSKSSLSQRLFFGAELLEHFADLPVGGMNESHGVIPFVRSCRRSDRLTSV